MLILLFSDYHQNFTQTVSLSLILLPESSSLNMFFLKSFLDCETINTIIYSNKSKKFIKEQA